MSGTEVGIITPTRLLATATYEVLVTWPRHPRWEPIIASEYYNENLKGNTLQQRNREHYIGWNLYGNFHFTAELERRFRIGREGVLTAGGFQFDDGAFEFVGGAFELVEGVFDSVGTLLNGRGGSIGWERVCRDGLTDVAVRVSFSCDFIPSVFIQIRRGTKRCLSMWIDIKMLSISVGTS